MKRWLSHVGTVVLVICAVAVTGLVVRRELGARPSAADTAAEVVDDWRSYAATGNRIGSEDAPVTVVVFSDFQCPACARFAESLHEVQARHPGRVSAVYRHFPLPNHAFAVPAARASECAAAQGRFREMHDELFRAQDSIGIRPFTRFAAIAGVPDEEAFEACLEDVSSAAAVRRDADAGSLLRLTATPTLLVNGRRVRGALSADRLEEMVVEALRDVR